jgi:hypothetical protein
LPNSNCGLISAYRRGIRDVESLRTIPIMEATARDNPQSAIRNLHSSLTDSPWFWVLAFSLMALGALVAIGGKYGRRQASIERKYQARERIAADRAAGNNLNAGARSDELADRRQFATPHDTLVPLWPLAAILVIVALFAGAMLYRGRGGPGSLNNESSSG